MICPRCGSPTAVATVVRGDADESTVGLCVACAYRWSAVGCETRNQAAGGPCGAVPELRCAECGRYVCRAHQESQHGRLCKTCAARLAKTVRAPGRGKRYGSWNRTGSLHE